MGCVEVTRNADRLDKIYEKLKFALSMAKKEGKNRWNTL